MRVRSHTRLLPQAPPPPLPCRRCHHAVAPPAGPSEPRPGVGRLCCAGQVGRQDAPGAPCHGSQPRTAHAWDGARRAVPRCAALPPTRPMPPPCVPRVCRSLHQSDEWPKAPSELDEVLQTSDCHYGRFCGRGCEADQAGGDLLPAPPANDTLDSACYRWRKCMKSESEEGTPECRQCQCHFTLKMAMEEARRRQGPRRRRPAGHAQRMAGSAHARLLWLPCSTGTCPTVRATCPPPIAGLPAGENRPVRRGLWVRDGPRQGGPGHGRGHELLPQARCAWAQYAGCLAAAAATA